MSSLLRGCSRQARIAAEALPLYRRGQQTMEIEQSLMKLDHSRRLEIGRMADELHITFEHAEGLYDMMRRREFGEPE